MTKEQLVHNIEEGVKAGLKDSVLGPAYWINVGEDKYVYKQDLCEAFASEFGSIENYILQDLHNVIDGAG